MSDEPKPFGEDNGAEMDDEDLDMDEEFLIMGDDDDLEGFEDEFDEETAEERSLRVTQETMEYFLEAADVTAVYSEPVEKGDSLIIPSAEVLAVMGFGVGSGYGQGPQGEDGSEAPGGSGSGGGGGGRVLARPVAVIVASPEGVRVEPVVDVTKIALAALTAGGFMLAMIARMLRGPKAGDSD